MDNPPLNREEQIKFIREAPERRAAAIKRWEEDYRYSQADLDAAAIRTLIDTELK